MMRVFYGWWIVVAAFLNLFYSVGIIYYGFPVFYPSLVDSLGFTRAQLTQGFLLGFVVAGLLFGLLAGVLIDRLGPRQVIRVGIWCVGLPLILMGSMTRIWHYYLLCIAEVFGYVLTGPIPNQVLISNWFRVKRGRAMGIAYLGLGAGGAVSPLLINSLIQSFGWRRAFEIIGALILIVLFPVSQWITRSSPRDLDLFPDGISPAAAANQTAPPGQESIVSLSVAQAVRSTNFWLILAGCTLTIGAIGAVTQHLIIFLKGEGYTVSAASQLLSASLVSSLAGRVVVGYFADRYSRKNVMALFYLILALAIPLLFAARRPAVVWCFVLVYGFAMGADYMLIPLVTADCFGLSALGKLLSLIIMGYSLGQWFTPWLAGKIFDTYHTYNLSWILMSAAAAVGAVLIYAIVPDRRPTENRNAIGTMRDDFATETTSALQKNF
ncbi:MAG TPA: MFS transporter [Candidatus Sulfotelmatobacter sp.]|nr:MFS transporter [Candidatus Sulfotelmatobacter sp.]